MVFIKNKYKFVSYPKIYNNMKQSVLQEKYPFFFTKFPGRDEKFLIQSNGYQWFIQIYEFRNQEEYLSFAKNKYGTFAYDELTMTAALAVSPFQYIEMVDAIADTVLALQSPAQEDGLKWQPENKDGL